MLVYGDHERRADPRLFLESLNRRLNRIAVEPAGLSRHASLVAALIEAGQLQQALADVVFRERYADAIAGQIEELGSGIYALGAAVCRSWDSAFADPGPLPSLLIDRELPEEIEMRVPEGFAFYTLYPEAYVEAARRLSLRAPPQVIGIRSIGTTLGAVVAAALGAPPAIHLRPFGDPFEREVAVEEDLERRLLDGDKHYVIVDEGPGQSGSSFASVAGWLRERGVADDRIALLPSHDGLPGNHATEERRRWWGQVQREVGDFGDRLPALVAGWIGQVLGPLDEPIREVSGGAWRALHYERDEQWPAVVPAWERRKFLATAGGERFLVKFAGLGDVGEEKLAIARSLHTDGFAPEPIALAHGFLIERWISDAAPLAGEKPVIEIGRYIGTRARTLRARGRRGAGIGELLLMARRNISLEFGAQFDGVLADFEQRQSELTAAVVPTMTDNRMLPHEWLCTRGGQLLKTDAADHHQSHDLIGCQDAAWDVAGAVVEFDLDEHETEVLTRAVADEARQPVGALLLRFYRVAYLAFRLGQMRMGASMTDSDGERRRIEAEGNRYARHLHLLLQERTAPTPQKSLVG